MLPRIASQVIVQADSIYYVHPSDGANSVTTTLKLDGANYAGWSSSMRRSLSVKNKLPIIDRPVKLSDPEDLNYADWERCNHLVHFWLINYVSDSIA